MKESEEHLQSLLQKIEQREQIARRRAIIYSVIPIILAALLLWFTAQQLNELKQQLKEATNFVKHVFPIDWRDMKSLASRYPQQERLLIDIIRMADQGVGWKLDGTSPEEGFDSPSFAAYMLKKHNLVDISLADPHRLQGRLMEKLKPTDEPHVGDLIFYDTGYTMFYFEDPRSGRPFCVGMTTVGIVILEIHFGPRILSYGDVEYK